MSDEGARVTITLRVPPHPTGFLDDLAALAAARGVTAEGTDEAARDMQERIARWQRMLAADDPDDEAQR